jgi:thioredoxin reductase (NADPH)
MAIGHTPNVAFLNGALELDERGYIKVKSPTTQTSVEGVLRAATLPIRLYRQAVRAAGTGCAAALDAEKWLTK